MAIPEGRYSRRHLLQVAAVTPVGAALLAACGAGGGAAAGSTSAGASATLAAATSSVAATASAASTASASTAAATSSAVMAAAPANAPKPTPTPAAGETHKGASLTLDLWYGWGGATAIATWQSLNTKMAEALTGFNVHWLTANNNTKLLTAIAGGTPPDVAVGNAPYPEFWARGAAQPLDDMIARSKVITKTDIPASSWSYASYKGKTYGVPAVEAFVRYALSLDMTNLKPLNVDPTKLSWDWDTLTQMQQELTKKSPNGSISVLGIDPLDAMGGSFGGGDPFYWGQAYDVTYFDETTGKFNFANDQLAEAMTTVKKIYDIAGGAKVVAGFHNSYGTWTESPTAEMPSGVEDMNVNGYWAPGELFHSSPSRKFAFTWAPVPTSRKGFKMQEDRSHKAFLPRGVKHPDQGFQLIEFLVNDAAEQIIFDNTGWLGARQSFLAKVDINKYPGLDFYVNSVKTADKIYTEPTDPIDGFVGSQWSTTVQNVIYGKAQPKDALAQMQQNVNNEIKQRFPNG